MSPRKAPASTAATRRQLRAADLATPDLSALNLNDLVKALQLRLEALERVQYVDVSITVGGSDMSPVSIAPPPWPVKGIFLARAWDATLGIPAAYVRIGWEQDANGLAVAMWIGDVSVGTTYDLTLEVRG